MRALLRLVLILSLLVLSGLSSCRQGETDASEARPGTTPEIRIVSLSPALTRTLADIGLADRIVGRTPWCTAVDEDVVVVGDLLNLDAERLVRLRPTHVFVQPAGGEVDPDLARLAERHGWTLASWRLDTISDVRSVLVDLPDLLPEPARTRVMPLLQERIEALTGLGGPMGTTWKEPTLLISQIDPVVAFGAGTYPHEMLQLLGGRNAVDASGWLTWTVEDLVRVDPAAVIVWRHDEGGETIADAVRRLPITAAEQDRVRVLTHPDALLPSTRIVEVTGELRDVLNDLARARP